MGTRLVNLVIDSSRPRIVADFWAALLGWEVAIDLPEEVDVRAPASDGWQLETYRAVNAVVDNASVIVAEDLSRTFTGRGKRGADTNRWWAAWMTGVTAEALTNVSGRERFCGAAG
jgi:hypothetical protein